MILTFDHCPGLIEGKTCTIRFKGDPKNPGVYSDFETIQTCEVHTGLTGKQHFDIVVEENQRKNLFLGLVAENFPQFFDVKIGDDGGESFVLKPGIIYMWAFDAERKLTISMPALRKVDKNQLQTLADQKFGISKVVLI